MSNTDPTWQEMLDRFTSSCPKDLLERIHSCQDVSSKIALCIQDDQVRESIGDWVKGRIKNNRFAKDGEKSTSLRLLGNRAFAGKTPSEAVELYVKSLLSSRVGSKEYLLAYGNLSAVYFHLNRYEDCIRAVDRSLDEEVDVRCLKLLLRKTKALINLAEVSKAREVLEKSQLLYNSLDRNGKKIDLTKFSCEISECLKSIASFGTKCAGRGDKDPSKPKLTINSSQEFPFASKSVELKESKEKGRFVVAKKKIDFGQVVFCEKPVVFVILPMFRLSHCNHCCLEVDCPVPCDGCSGVVYCSVECKEESHLYHKYECDGTLAVAYSTGIAHLALRLFLVGSLDWQGYSRVNGLLHLAEKLPPEDIYNYSLTGYALAVCLEEGKFIARIVPEVIERLTLDICRLVLNGHSIREVRTRERRPGKVAEETEDEIATAIYPSVSMLNHSCRSNIANCFYGQYLIVKAKEEIKEGQEVFNCYGVDCTRNSREERQSVLKAQYKFDCDCAPCSSPIDPFDVLSSLSCQNCSGPVVRGVCLECSHRQHLTKETLRILNEDEKKFSCALEYAERDCKRALELLDDVLQTRVKYLYKNNINISTVYDSMAKYHSVLENYDKVYEILKEHCIPLTRNRYGSNSIELANVTNNCINVICSLMMTKYGANSPDCDVKDSGRVMECIEMMEKTEVLFELNYGTWSDKYRTLMCYKNFLVPLSQVWQYFLQPKQLPTSQ